MNLLSRSKLQFISILIFSLNLYSTSRNEFYLQSPNKNLSVTFRLQNKSAPSYSVTYFNDVIVQKSRLGIIREDDDFSKYLMITSVSAIETISSEYEVLGRKCSYQGNRQIFHLQSAGGGRMDIIFQVSNDGVAFRYSFPDTSLEIKKITEEISSFHFSSATKTWIQPMANAKEGWCSVNPSYEEYYQQGIAVEKLKYNRAGWVFPALFNTGNVWMLITETAPDRNYCNSRLIHDSTSKEFCIGFPQDQEIYPNGELKPQSILPWNSPWRIIAIGNLKTIVESTLGTDFAVPKKYSADYAKSGKASWSWPLLKDDSTIFNVQKRFIDYAYEMNWDYCLIDALWDTQIGYDSIKTLADYARTKNVGILLWYNSAGSWNTAPQTPRNKLLTHDDRVKEFSRLKEMGIKGVKVDFFGADGQSMIRYYQDIIEDAASFGLMVNCHGATLPRGWHRTYPNLMTMEAVKGFEFSTFGQEGADSIARHCSIIPFTRNVFDPMDFTPMCFSEIPNIKRKTTNGFELALSVLFWSGIQHYAEIPEGMASVPDYVREYLRELPSQWKETKFIDGYPGKYVVIARRWNEDWYVAGINGDGREKEISIRLPFVSETQKGTLISDGNNNRSFSRQEIVLPKGKPLKIKLKANGGFVFYYKKYN